MYTRLFSVSSFLGLYEPWEESKRDKEREGRYIKELKRKSATVVERERMSEKV
jgi:hypothetical protein